MSRKFAFYTELSGCHADNPDGTSRLDYIKNCQVGDPLQLKPNPDNPYDEEAIGVYHHQNDRNCQIGWVPMANDINALINEHLDSGDEVSIEITALDLQENYTGVSVLLSVVTSFPIPSSLEEMIEDEEPNEKGEVWL